MVSLKAGLFKLNIKKYYENKIENQNKIQSLSAYVLLDLQSI